MTTPTVSKAAIEAAVEWLRSTPHGSRHAEADMIEAGEYDSHSLVQAFARFEARLTAQPALPDGAGEIVERLRALESFLRGTGEIDGLWFGEGKPMAGGRNAPYWWRRSHLGALSEAADTILALQARVAALEAGLREVGACMLNGTKDAPGDYGWNISRLTKSRPMIRALLADAKAGDAE